MSRILVLIAFLGTPIAAIGQTFECAVVKVCHLVDPCQNPPIETLIDLTINDGTASAVYSPRGGGSLELQRVDGALPDTLHYAGKDAGAGATFVSLFPTRHAIFVHHSLIQGIPGSITFLTRCEEA